MNRNDCFSSASLNVTVENVARFTTQAPVAVVDVRQIGRVPERLAALSIIPAQTMRT